MKGLKTAAALLSALALSGCGQQRVLERLGFINVNSYDLQPNGELKMAAFIPKIGNEYDSQSGGSTSGQSSSSSGPSGELLTTTAHSSKEARMIQSRQTSWELVSGQLRNTLFGMSVAKQGLWPYIDTLIRDPTISPRLKLTIVDGEAAELLNKTYPQHPSIGRYLDRLLEKLIQEEAIPRMLLYDFERDYFDDGIDPAIPILRNAGDSVELSGIGLFRDDVYAARIQPADGLLFHMLRGTTGNGEINIEVAGGGHGLSHAMLSSLASSRKVKIGRDALGRIAVRIRLDVEGAVLEYMGDLKISNDKQRRELEARIAESLTERAENLVALMQKNRVDSLGIGSIVRNGTSFAQWKKMNWREEFAKAKITVRVKMKINNYGKFR